MVIGYAVLCRRLLRRSGAAKAAVHKVAETADAHRRLHGEEGHGAVLADTEEPRWRRKARQRKSQVSARALQGEVSELTMEQLVSTVLRGYEGFADAGCNLFARKFEHAAAEQLQAMAAAYLSSGNQTRLLRQLLFVSPDIAWDSMFQDPRFH